MISRSRHPQSVAVWVPAWGRILILTRFETLVNDVTDPDFEIEREPWMNYEITGNYVIELGVQIAHLEQTE